MDLVHRVHITLLFCEKLKYQTLVMARIMRSCSLCPAIIRSVEYMNRCMSVEDGRVILMRPYQSRSKMHITLTKIVFVLLRCLQDREKTKANRTRIKQIE